MDLHQRQQFDFLLQTATERFVAAIFADFLLDNADGAAFVLRSLPKRSIVAHRGTLAAAATVEEALAGPARGLFAEILLMKTLEALDQNAGYLAVGPAAR